MAGENILHYQVVEKLGAGGMGEVYKAHDPRLNRFVAIKSLLSAVSGDPVRRRRFIQEAQAASALNHPNIITIHDIVSQGDAQYMVMEFVEGKSLADMIPLDGFPIPLALKYAVQIADALAAAHGAGIVHRDLKPANVMVTSSGRVKILDFGLAKLSPAEPCSQTDKTVSTPNAALTVEGTIFGTVSYMSPEQAEGKQVDARSDIFSFGAVLYEVVTGQRAFDGKSNISVIMSVLRDEVKPVSELAPDVPPLIEQIILRCLRKDPDDRWQTMQEVVTELNALKQQSDSGVLYKSQIQIPPAAAKRGAPKRKAMIGAAAAVVVALAGTGGWWWKAHKVVEQPVVTAPALPPAPAPPPEATAVPPPAPAEVVLNNDSVIEMLQAKVPQSVILTNIRAAKTAFDLSAAGVIKLIKSGVPANVIEAMHNPKSVPAAPPARVASSKQPAAPPITPSPAQSDTPSSPTPAAPAATTTPPPAVTNHPPPANPAPQVPAAISVTLADAMPIRITLAEDVPADAGEGQALRFTVADDVKAGGGVAIAKGSAVTGEIVEGAKKKFLRKSKITYRLRQVATADGHKLNLRATPARNKDDAPARPLEGGAVPKSKDLAAAKGAEYIAYIDGGQTVMVRK